MTPVIDGVPLSDLVADFEAVFDVPERGGYAGIVVGASGDPLADTLLSAGAAVPVLGCGCGETECWPLDADIRFDDWSVTWTGSASRSDRDGPTTASGLSCSSSAATAGQWRACAPAEDDRR